MPARRAARRTALRRVRPGADHLRHHAARYRHSCAGTPSTTPSWMNRRRSRTRWRRPPRPPACSRPSHRLVLTGTPVENNTFELWSQFAFLNPGLLGSLDYFTDEFVTPIEKKGDEETAQLLRTLGLPVHPAPHQGAGRARAAAAHRAHPVHRHGAGPAQALQPHARLLPRHAAGHDRRRRA